MMSYAGVLLSAPLLFFPLFLIKFSDDLIPLVIKGVLPDVCWETF